MILKKISKKAQMGETMTWVVATIIIIFMLMIFVFASHALAKSQKILSSKLVQKAYNAVDSNNSKNLLESKTASAHKLALDKNKEEIDNWINFGGKND